MSDQRSDRHVEVERDGRVVGSADVHPRDGRTVRAELHLESGHLPPEVGASLVDAVLDLPEVPAGSRLEATIPLGETGSLLRLRDRCCDVHSHAAGASCLVDATLPEPAQPDAARPDAARSDVAQPDAARSAAGSAGARTEGGPA